MKKEKEKWMPIPLSKKQEKILPKSILVSGGKKNPPKKTKNK